ncbi:MAG: type 2 lanthipeptide synthetase LanM family protein [Candidatus Rokuibacteriota bacterium]
MIEPAMLARIAARASSLAERLTAEIAGAPDGSPGGGRANEQLARWRQTAAAGDPEAFRKRLRWDGLDEELARGALTPPDPRTLLELPPWTGVLAQIADAALQQGSIPAPPERLPSEDTPAGAGADLQLPLVADDPLPFEELLLPALVVARRLLHRRLQAVSGALHASPLRHLSEMAYWALERSLLVQLTALAAPALESEFSGARPAGYRLLPMLLGETTFRSRAYYDAFVRNVLGDGLLGFFDRWPVLARLTSVLTSLWVESTAELLERLEADWTALHETFAGCCPAGRAGEHDVEDIVVSLRPCLSDRHHGGRSVAALTLASGLTLVYKPRSLGLESALQRLLAWCNETGELPHRFKVLAVRDRSTHGWVELAEHAPCRDLGAAGRFYERAGMLLCLLHVLRATDCHVENLIACGEDPVLVDAEALLHHDLDPDALATGTPGATSIDETFGGSVLRTGMLPRWEFDLGDGQGVDISALGGVSRFRTGRTLRWRGLNTDELHRAWTEGPPAVYENVPHAGGTELDPDAFLEEILTGFRAMYRFLMTHRARLEAEHGPLASFRDAPARFVFRPTRSYQALLEQSVAPDRLGDGADRSIALEALCRAYLTADRRPPAWPVLRQELASLERFDIPYLTAAPTGTTLRAGSESIPAFFAAASYDQVRERLASLSEADLELQVGLIRGAFLARTARAPSAPGSAAPAAGTHYLDVPAPFSVADLLGEAAAIARDLRSRALVAAAGGVNWIGLTRAPRAERYQLQPLGAGLYSGASGVALFLAAVDRVTGERQFGGLARAAIAPLRDVLACGNRELLARWVREIGIGGGDGLGSVIYALMRIGSFLDDASVLQDARRVTALITPALIRGDRWLDVMGGAAGLLLALVALHRESGDELALQHAIACAEHLLDRRGDGDEGRRAWRTIEPHPLTGFAHGAAGIAYALLRLHGVAPEVRYLEAAAEGIAYERSVFSPAARNWPDLRGGRGPADAWYMVSWCHGAAGIGLARLAALDVLDGPHIREDIEAALATTLESGLQEVDHLCCGNAGRTETLLAAATRLGHPHLLDRAARQAAWIVRRAGVTGGYRLFPDFADQVFSPCLFQGAAGIGYLLLRLSRPDLPSVLAFS